ncbi:hypothetical protein HMPREF9137_0234 [Prevotella denticola F0289]|nr:hypothetical protein HMPREF9137_0234 [Prevotella denticola F0289]
MHKVGLKAPGTDNIQLQTYLSAALWLCVANLLATGCRFTATGCRNTTRGSVAMVVAHKYHIHGRENNTSGVFHASGKVRTFATANKIHPGRECPM